MSLYLRCFNIDAVRLVPASELCPQDDFHYFNFLKRQNVTGKFQKDQKNLPDVLAHDNFIIEHLRSPPVHFCGCLLNHNCVIYK